MKRLRLLCILAILTFSLAACSQERKAYERARELSSTEALERFLQAYPDGVFAEQARDGIVRLDLATAEAANTPETLHVFLEEHPDHPLAAAARESLSKFDFDTAREVDTLEAYQDFIAEYRSGRWVREAKEIVWDRELEEAREENSVEAYQRFIDRYAESPQASNAQESLDFLVASRAGTSDAYEGFLRNHPEGRHSGEATAALTNLLFEKAKSELTAILDEEVFYASAIEENSVDAYSAYLEIYATGSHRDQIEGKLEILQKEAEQRRRGQRAELESAAGTLTALTDELWSLRPSVTGMGFSQIADSMERFNDELAARQERLSESFKLILDSMNPQVEKDFEVRAQAWQCFQRIWFPFFLRHLSGWMTAAEMGVVKEGGLAPILDEESHRQVLAIARESMAKYDQVLDLLKDAKGQPSVTRSSISLGGKTVRIDD